jgi:hypothetical protein
VSERGSVAGTGSQRPLGHGLPLEPAPPAPPTPPAPPPEPPSSTFPMPLAEEETRR